MKKNNYLIPEWPAPTRIHAYTTTRTIPGFSAAPYDQFNLGDHVGDFEEAVIKNREKLHLDLDLPHAPLWLKQVHGTKVVEMDQYLTETITIEACAPTARGCFEGKSSAGGRSPTSHCRKNNPEIGCAASSIAPPIEADACYSRMPNTVCAVLTADCLPILICNQKGTEVAAIHAGWRGLLAGVIENTITALSSNPSELLAWLGPAIGPNHFQINQEIRSSFLEKSSTFESGFILHDGTDWFGDLFQLARVTLLNAGVSAIYGGQHCTYSDSHFYSYRRDQQLTGRMASLIWIGM